MSNEKASVSTRQSTNPSATILENHNGSQYPLKTVVANPNGNNQMLTATAVQTGNPSLNGSANTDIDIPMNVINLILWVLIIVVLMHFSGMSDKPEANNY